MTIVEKNAHTRARIATAITASLVLLCLLFYSFTTQNKLDEQEEEGIIVSFGTLELGGSNSAEANLEQEQAQEPSEPVEEAESVDANESTLTEQNTENLAIPKEQPKKEQPKKQVEKKEPEKSPEKATDNKEQKTPAPAKPKVNERALYPGSSKPGDNPGTGGGDKQGNAGTPDGDIDGQRNGGQGGEGKSGVGYSLSGRKLISSPTVKDNSNIEGKITVKIKVDQRGQVISASLGTPTTITNSALINKSIAAAKQAKFDKNSQASEEQFGSITFTYRVQ